MAINYKFRLIKNKYLCRCKFSHHMVIQDFIKKLEEEFEDIKPGALQPDSNIRDHFTWDSINALVFIAMVNVEYDVTLNADDLQRSNTIKDVYDVIVSRMNHK